MFYSFLYLVNTIRIWLDNKTINLNNLDLTTKVKEQGRIKCLIRH
jgi:hypothetical protein